MNRTDPPDVKITSADEIARLALARVITPAEAREMLGLPPLDSTAMRSEVAAPSPPVAPHPPRPMPQPDAARVRYKGKTYRKMAVTKDGKRVKLGLPEGRSFPDGRTFFWVDTAVLYGGADFPDEGYPGG